MKKYKYIILTIMLFLLNVSNTYAECTKEDIAAFKKVEDKYTIKYEFNKTTKTYDVTFYKEDYKTGQNKYTYDVGDMLKDAKQVSSTKTSYTYSGIKPGDYIIKVDDISNDCIEALKTIELKLPKYNSYSDDPLCDGFEEFVLCQPTYDKEIDYETFTSRVNTYRKTKLNKNEDKEEKQEENTILQYIKDNLIQIIIVIAFIILVVITLSITIKSIRKSRRLE